MVFTVQLGYLGPQSGSLVLFTILKKDPTTCAHWCGLYTESLSVLASFCYRFCIAYDVLYHIKNT